MDQEALLQHIQTDCDWEQAFAFSSGDRKITASGGLFPSDVSKGIEQPAEPFDREDVGKVYGMIDGEGDEADWIGVFLLKDGRFACLRAGCDYTGWG